MKKLVERFMSWCIQRAYNRQRFLEKKKIIMNSTLKWCHKYMLVEMVRRGEIVIWTDERESSKGEGYAGALAYEGHCSADLYGYLPFKFDCYSFARLTKACIKFIKDIPRLPRQFRWIVKKELLYRPQLWLGLFAAYRRELCEWWRWGSPEKNYSPWVWILGSLGSVRGSAGTEYSKMKGHDSVEEARIEAIEMILNRDDLIDYVENEMDEKPILGSGVPMWADAEDPTCFSIDEQCPGFEYDMPDGWSDKKLPSLVKVWMQRYLGIDIKVRLIAPPNAEPKGAELDEGN